MVFCKMSPHQTKGFPANHKHANRLAICVHSEPYDTFGLCREQPLRISTDFEYTNLLED